MSKKNLAIGLMVIGLCLSLFPFRHYSAHSARLYSIGSLILMILAYFFYRWVSMNPVNTVNTAAQDENIKQFKAKSDKISVSVSECEIIDNNYTEEHEILHGREASINILFSERHNIETVEIKQCVIIYDTDMDGTPKRFISPVIPKDKATVTFQFEAHGPTEIYIDPDNTENYYFDLAFLFE